MLEAVKPSAFRQEFRFTVGGRDDILRRLSLLGREFGAWPVAAVGAWSMQIRA